MPRPFTPGSRQAPDPLDNFLEENGYYRKHTARDSSCLFRVVSEQMYDTQIHHLSVREACVNYMRRNRNHYQHEIGMDIDDYLNELSKQKTCGTLLELQVMAFMYQRNVFLFQPMDRGTPWIYEENFKEAFQIFMSHDNHFDTVYTLEYIEDAAFCQSLSYEILYKKVFKLPDVTYAVERMLHGSSFEEISMRSVSDGPYCRQMIFDDGRIFEFDPPETTSCILNNSQLCHFHNSDFLKFKNNLNEMNDYEENCQHYGQQYRSKDQSMNDNRTKTMDSLLPEKYVSCVRQLLSECITPFPYKVAKALDPDMYRNIEFDSWSEMRKEMIFKNVYAGANTLQNSKSLAKRHLFNFMDKQSTSSLQVGVKCQVYLQKSDEIFTGYIQEMSGEAGPCTVFIEQLGEKKIVQFDCLKPLPSDQITPWALPYRLQQHLEKYNNNVRPTKYLKRYSRVTYKVLEYKTHEYHCNNSLPNNRDDVDFKLKQYCGLDNFQPPPVEMLTMPLTVEHNNRLNNKHSSSTPMLSHTVEPTSTGDDDLNTKRPESSVGGHSLETIIDENNQYDLQNSQHVQQLNNNIIDCPGLMNESPYSYGYAEPCYSYPYADSSIVHAASSHGALPNPNGQYYCVLPTTPGTAAPVALSYQQNGPNGIYIPPPGQAIHGYYQTTPMPYYATTMPSVPTYALGSGVVGSCTIQSAQINSISRSSSFLTDINYAVHKSTQENGSDLPNDVATLQFFFNLGVEFYNGTENGDTNKLSADFQKSIKIENELKTKPKQDANNNNIDTNSNNMNNHSTNTNDRGGHKRYNMKYYQNRKGQNSFRSGNTGGNNTYNRFSSFSGGGNKNNTYRNNNGRNNNLNGPCKTNTSNQNVNLSTNNSNGGNERSKNERNSEQNNQTSVTSTASDLNDYNQSSTNVLTPNTTIPPNNISDNENIEHQEFQNQNNFSGNINNNVGNPIYMPHIVPMPFGMCSATPTTNSMIGQSQPSHPNSSHNSHNAGATGNGSFAGNYPYITTGLPPPTTHPPLPLAQMPSGCTMTAAPFPQTPPQPGSFYYTPTTKNTAENQGFVTTPGTGEIISGGGVIEQSVSQHQYSFMNCPWYYQSSNGTPIANGGGGLPNPNNIYHQGYWYAPTQQTFPARPQSQNNITPIAATSQSNQGNCNKMNSSGNSSNNVSH